jgi:AraC family transcriptional regulator, transcriptional activator of pobA
MPAKAPIPQFALVNSLGKAVDFDLQVWGSAENYDFLKAHRHNFYEVLVFEKGTAQHDIDFATHPAKRGTLHFVAPDNVHLLVRSPQSAGLSLMFAPDFIDESLLSQLPFNTPQPVLALPPAEFKEAQAIIKHIQAEYVSPGVLSGKIIRSLTEVLLLRLLRIYCSVQPTQPAEPSTHLQRFKQLAAEHYTQHLPVEAYAAKLGISAKHLIDICKKQTGKTPLRHISAHVVSEARRLLFHTPLSVKEIAYKLGFESPAHFSKYFKLHAGYSPAAYREGKR